MRSASGEFPPAAALGAVLAAGFRPSSGPPLSPQLLRHSAFVALLKAGLPLGVAFLAVTPASKAGPLSATEQGRRMLRRIGWTVESVSAEAALRFLAEWLRLPSSPRPEETTR